MEKRYKKAKNLFPHIMTSHEEGILLRMNRQYTESEAYNFVKSLLKESETKNGQLISYIDELHHKLEQLENDPDSRNKVEKIKQLQIAIEKRNEKVKLNNEKFQFAEDILLDRLTDEEVTEYLVCFEYNFKK